MSLLDRVTKAVGDAVDRGKKEVDQFVRIQRIYGEISEVEKRIAEFRSQIQQVRQQAGEKAIEMLRSGSVVSPDLQPFLEQVDGIEKQIAAQEVEITRKRAEIDTIKTEHEAAKAAASAPPATPPPVPVPGEGTPSAPTADGPGSSARFCTQCGAPFTGGGAFCTQCGAKRI